LHKYAWNQFTPFRIICNAIILTLVSVAVSAMFKALLRPPKEAAGAKAAAEPIKREVTTSFILAQCMVRISSIYRK
jgi:hypothetical protein